MSEESRVNHQVGSARAKRQRRREEARAISALATRLETINKLTTTHSPNTPTEGNFTITMPIEQGSPVEASVLSLQEDNDHQRVPRARNTVPNFWDNLEFTLDQFFAMAVPVARATIRLADFTQFAGLWDEDPNAHVQRFEVTCVANEIHDNEQKLHIFPATLKDEAALWYGNLDAASRVTYNALRCAFLTKFHRQGFNECLAQQLDYLVQGMNESMDHYIARMETIVQK